MKQPFNTYRRFLLVDSLLPSTNNSVIRNRWEADHCGGAIQLGVLIRLGHQNGLGFAADRVEVVGSAQHAIDQSRGSLAVLLGRGGRHASATSVDSSASGREVSIHRHGPHA